MLLELSVRICLQAVVLKQQETWSCHIPPGSENSTATGSCRHRGCLNNAVELSTPGVLKHCDLLWATNKVLL